MSNIITYDGTYDGFITAVFDIYEYKIQNPIIKSKLNFDNELFSEEHEVLTDPYKVKRILKSLKDIIATGGLRTLYYAFLSELNAIENSLYEVMKYAFDSKINIMADFSHPTVLKVSQTARKVAREKHRMEAFVRFQLTKDNIYFANIEPDFNVLPLIKEHFVSRYADQKWIIYDLKRSYGLFYDLTKTQHIHIDFSDHFETIKSDSKLFTKEELLHQELWKEYFKSTNIEERINTSLHIKHVPKRYWKYLTEKKL